MNFQVGWTAKKVLKEHVYENYGRIMNEIYQLEYTPSPKEFRDKVETIIRKYSSKTIKEYHVIVKDSGNSKFNYIFTLRKKKKRKA